MLGQAETIVTLAQGAGADLSLAATNFRLVDSLEPTQSFALEGAWPHLWILSRPHTNFNVICVA